MFPWSRDAVRLDHSGGDVVGLSAGSRVAFILSTPQGRNAARVRRLWRVRGVRFCYLLCKGWVMRVMGICDKVGLNDKG